MDLCQVGALRPIPNLLYFDLMQNATFECALVTDNGGVWCSEDELLGGNCSIDILEALQNPVYNSEMISDKSPYTQVFWDCLVRAVRF